MSASSTDPGAIHPIRLRLLTLENNLVMAPMAGVSNLPFRLIARQAGAALAFTETVSAKGLVRGGRKTWRLLETSPREAPVAFPGLRVGARRARGGLPPPRERRARSGSTSTPAAR